MADNVLFEGDSVAAAWERHRERVFETTRPVSDWLVEHVVARPGATVLELTAGPGETGFLVAERVGDDGRVLATDLSPAMVAAARRGVEARGLTNVECRVMDAQQLDLDDDSVDGVLSRFGVMLTPEPARVAREARRVLRPGGSLAYGVWGPAERNPWILVLAGALLQCGHVPDADPFGPGGPVLARHGRRQPRAARRRRVRGRGHRGAHRCHALRRCRRLPRRPGLARRHARSAGRVALPGRARGSAATALATGCEPFRAAGGIELPWLAVCTTGTA